MNCTTKAQPLGQTTLPAASSITNSFSSSEDPTPSSFYVVRIISKAPCMVLRLGFPIGTPAQARNKVNAKLQHIMLTGEGNRMSNSRDCMGQWGSGLLQEQMRTTQLNCLVGVRIPFL